MSKDLLDPDNPYLKPPVRTENESEFFPSSLCRLNMAPFLLTGMLVSLAREHFADPEAIDNPLLQKYVWRTGDDTSILIESISRAVYTRLQMRPGIIIKRHAMRPQRLGINDEIMNADMIGPARFLNAWTGNHTAFCISGNPGEAENLANETALYFQNYAPIIRKSLGNSLYDFGLAEIGELGMLEGASDQYVVPVVFEHKTSHSWAIETNRPKLRKFSIQMLINPYLDK